MLRVLSDAIGQRARVMSSLGRRWIVLRCSIHGPLGSWILGSVRGVKKTGDPTMRWGLGEPIARIKELNRVQVVAVASTAEP